jgi:hypothetical protein
LPTRRIRPPPSGRRPGETRANARDVASSLVASWNVGAGVVSYNDGTDQFCADAYTGGGTRIVEVRLTPISRPGPSYTWTDSNSSGAATCRSLATAYEDTNYRATVRTYWGETAEWTNRGSKTFYS